MGPIKHIANIRTSGTIAPSSGFLVDRLLEGVDFGSARELVELGVGTGCVTREILRRMRPDARLFSLEINPIFIEACRSIRDPRLVLVEGCATHLPRILEDEGLDGVDAVISSLPLSIMDDGLVDAILDISRDSLRPGGRFVQYQYSLSQRARLDRRFADVGVDFTLLNVPPAFVYSCARQEAPVRRRAAPRVAFGSVYAAVLSAVALAVRTYQQL